MTLDTLGHCWYCGLSLVIFVYRRSVLDKGVQWFPVGLAPVSIWRPLDPLCLYFYTTCETRGILGGTNLKTNYNCERSEHLWLRVEGPDKQIQIVAAQMLSVNFLHATYPCYFAVFSHKNLRLSRESLVLYKYHKIVGTFSVLWGLQVIQNCDRLPDNSRPVATARWVRFV